MNQKPSERMPGRTPWTVSVAVYPGDSPCPELESLDLALKKNRCHVWIWDELLEAWKARIKWPPEKEEWGPPICIKPTADMLRQLLWTSWISNQVRCSLGVPAEYLGKKAT